MMCDVLEVGRSSYYDWLNVQPSKHTLENQTLATKIKECFMESRCTYGTRRIRKMLMTQGISISRRRVGKLMKQQQL